MTQAAARPFVFDTEFDADGSVVQPSAFKPVKRAYAPAEVEALVAQARLEAREAALAEVESIQAMGVAAIGQALGGEAAEKLGLIPAAPDDIDWADEVRIALEERAAMSPDALTGLEANLRFAQQENMFTRIFGRLSAWQNWIFQRPNAVGDKGALKVYGKGDKAQFDMNRV